MYLENPRVILTTPLIRCFSVAQLFGEFALFWVSGPWDPMLYASFVPWYMKPKSKYAWCVPSPYRISNAYDFPASNSNFRENLFFELFNSIPE